MIGSGTPLHHADSSQQTRYCCSYPFCTGLVVLSVCLFWRYGLLRTRIAFAVEQTQIFEEMRLRVLQTPPSEAAGCLQYVVCYYPSGTKQQAGSSLDRMVERERQRVVSDIMDYLRAKTGEDLGKELHAWIDKHGRK